MRAGFSFEARVAQAAMIEALCMHYLMLLKKVTGKTIHPNLQAKLSKGRITFGQLKDAVAHTELLEPEALEALSRPGVCGPQPWCPPGPGRTLTSAERTGRAHPRPNLPPQQQPSHPAPFRTRIRQTTRRDDRERDG